MDDPAHRRLLLRHPLRRLHQLGQRPRPPPRQRRPPGRPLAQARGRGARWFSSPSAGSAPKAALTLNARRLARRISAPEGLRSARGHRRRPTSPGPRWEGSPRTGATTTTPAAATARTGASATRSRSRSASTSASSAIPTAARPTRRAPHGASRAASAARPARPSSPSSTHRSKRNGTASARPTSGSSTPPIRLGRDLRRANLGGAFLADADLRGARLEGAASRGAAGGGEPQRGAAGGGEPLARRGWRGRTSAGRGWRGRTSRGAAGGGGPQRGAAGGGGPRRGAAGGGGPQRGAAGGGEPQRGAAGGGEPQNADFRSSNWAGASNRASTAQFADFRGAQALTQAQLDELIGNAATLLPEVTPRTGSHGTFGAAGNPAPRPRPHRGPRGRPVR